MVLVVMMVLEELVMFVRGIIKNHKFLFLESLRIQTENFRRKKNQKNVKTKFKSTLTLESYIALFPFELLSNGATIRIGREIQCLPYAGYFYPQLK